MTCLIAASLVGSEDVVGLLLKKMRPPVVDKMLRSRDESGYDALYYACLHGHLEVGLTSGTEAEGNQLRVTLCTSRWSRPLYVPLMLRGCHTW